MCRQFGVGQATFYIWSKKYAHMGVSERRELRQLRDENTPLERLVADLTLDKQILSDVVKKSFEVGVTPSTAALDFRTLPVECAACLRKLPRQGDSAREEFPAANCRTSVSVRSFVIAPGTRSFPMMDR